MRKQLFLSISALAVAVLSGYNMYFSKPNTKGLSDLALANVEALAVKEDLTGGYDVLEQISDHYYNGELYRQSKITECYSGGKHECTRSSYNRYKNEDGSWGKWIPV